MSQAYSTRPLGHDPHWRYFDQKPFTRSQRPTTTVLFGGLTFKHERLIKSVLASLGYKTEIIPTPTVKDFQTGKEYGNYGQCNPTYFTTGALVNYLKKLERAGLQRDDIVERYVYLTATSPCGPCRFGMYQNEYRLALDNTGFNGFRVITIEQRPSLKGNADAGLDVNIEFSFAVLFAVLIGDLLNETAYLIRPYECRAGETDAVLERSLAAMERTLAALDPGRMETGGTGWLRRTALAGAGKIELLLALHHFFIGAYQRALLRQLREIGEWFDAVPIDRSRVKPIVKVTGEFWAQTTEGDGNFGMFQFLEKEGAAVLVEPVATWLSYLLHVAEMTNEDQTRLIDKDELDITALDRMHGWYRFRKKKMLLDLMNRRLNTVYDNMRRALKDIPHALVDQNVYRELAHDFYHSRSRGGEGHLEVGKNIHYHRNHLAHMVLSLKPFGCMPSTQSDGVQAAVQGAFGDMIYLPVETSGEGEVNAHSRVQMALGEAKQKAKNEFADVLAACGMTVDGLAQQLAVRPGLQRPAYTVPRRSGVAGTAANLVYHVADLVAAGDRDARSAAHTA